MLCAAIDSPEGRSQRFVQLWTLKEAYVKAVGQGISAPPGLKGFSVLLHDDHTVAHRARQVTTAEVEDTAYRISFQASSDSSADKWGFMLLSLSDRHTAALCVELPSQAAQLISRQNSDDSAASTSTFFGAVNADCMETDASDCMEIDASDKHTSFQSHVKVTFRNTIPLVTDDSCRSCCIQGAGGLWPD